MNRKALGVLGLALVGALGLGASPALAGTQYRGSHGGTRVVVPEARVSISFGERGYRPAHRHVYREVRRDCDYRPPRQCEYRAPRECDSRRDRARHAGWYKNRGRDCR